MDDETTERLMGYLGLAYHRVTDDVTPNGEWRMCACGFAYIRPESHVNLTFDTPADLHAILSAIVENGKWEDFCDYAFSKSPAGQSRYNAMEHAPINAPRLYLYDTKYIAWLFCLNAPAEIPERLKLVGEWLKGRG